MCVCVCVCVWCVYPLVHGLAQGDDEVGEKDFESLVYVKRTAQQESQLCGVGSSLM